MITIINNIFVTFITLKKIVKNIKTYKNYFVLPFVLYYFNSTFFNINLKEKSLNLS